MDDSTVLAIAVAVDCSDAEEEKALEEDEEEVLFACSVVLIRLLSVTAWLEAERRYCKATVYRCVILPFHRFACLSPSDTSTH